jgi:hypothetical protein
MFVLSVGFLAAQGHFAYQAVVVDADGNLVVNQMVTANVTITDGNGVSEQLTFDDIPTSPNGHALLDIVDPGTIDWKTANINVQFTATGVTIPDYGPERVPGAPYALQTLDDELTTEMIVDYYSRATTTMDDMNAIFDALEYGNPSLAEDWKDALIDTIIHNRAVAKEIVLHYLNTGTADDVQAMFMALSGNEPAMAAIIEDVKDLIGESPSDVREILYDILSYYTTHMTPTDVNNVYNALPNNVKLKLAELCVSYLKDHKVSVIMPIALEYMEKITVDEFVQLIQALENNAAVYPIMLAQFNTWLDEYFESRFSGGNHVQNVVESTIQDNYYAQCTPDAVDLCELKENLAALNTCFAVTNEIVITKDPSNEGFFNPIELHYTGTAEPSQSESSFSITGTSTLMGGEFYAAGPVDVDLIEKNITISPYNLYGQIPELLPGDGFTLTVTIKVPACDPSTITVSGSYVEQ